MRARFDVHQAEREAAEVVQPSGVKVWRGEGRATGKPWLKMWMPKATKPFVNYTFRTVEQREEYASNVIANVTANQAAKAEAREKRKNPSNAERVEVGTVFVHSWGWEQTNVDYYEVVSKSGSYVEVRPIASEEVPGTQGFMSATVKPVPGAFVTNSFRMRKNDGSYRQSLRKKVQYTESGSAYLSFEYGWCGVNRPGEQRYSSWYA